MKEFTSDGGLAAMLAPPPVSRFQMHWLIRLALRLSWWMIHLLFSIYQFGEDMLKICESYMISVGLLENYQNLSLNGLKHLAVVVDSEEARCMLRVKKLLLWLSNIGVNSVILYDLEGVLKRYLDGDLSTTNKDMTIEILSFADSKAGVAKAATFLCSKYLKEEDPAAACNRKDFSVTESEISDALNSVGCGGPDPDLLLVYGPVRCHLGFPAWRIRYTEIVHMGSLQTIKYGAILKVIYEYSKKQQNYGT